MKHSKIIFPILLLLFFTACKKEELIKQLQDIDISQSDTGIVPLPDGFHKKMNDVFSKYTKVTAPNGRPIHLFAQSGVSDAKLIRARSILEMYLTNVPGAEYGTSKFFVANSMADKNAALFFFDTQDSYESNSGKLAFVPFNWQDLYADEAFVEGSPEYIANDPRDASYEEILHLTQDYGITPTMPLYQSDIQKATDAAVSNRWYQPPSELPKADYDQEYFATVWDVYLDVWAYTSSAQFDEYQFNSRENLLQNDPAGHKLIEAFLPKMLTYNAQIHSDFEGVFYMAEKADLSYTLKSKHLLHATLTGNIDSGVSGNEHSNSLSGNTGDNTLEGKSGNDELNGNEGTDTAIFTGNHAEYNIETSGGITTVTDQTADRDGTDRLINIEKIQFADQTINL